MSLPERFVRRAVPALDADRFFASVKAAFGLQARELLDAGGPSAQPVSVHRVFDVSG